MVSLNCHITSGFSGAEVEQFVAAMGRAPLAATLRALRRRRASRRRGDSIGTSGHCRRWRARGARFPAPVCGSLMRTDGGIARAGAGERVGAYAVSYCSVIQRLEAMAGDDSSFTKFAVRFVPSAAKANQSAAVSFLDAGAAMGRL